MRPKQRRLRKKVRRSSKSTGERRSAEGITIAWMLCTLSCVAAQVVCLVVSTYVAAVAEHEGVANVLADLLLAIASLTGLLVLLLTPLVYWFRRTPPPLGVTIASLGFAVLPIALFAGIAVHR